MLPDDTLCPLISGVQDLLHLKIGGFPSMLDMVTEDMKSCSSLIVCRYVSLKDIHMKLNPTFRQNMDKCSVLSLDASILLVAQYF